MKKLNQLKCVPCEGGIPPLTTKEISPLLRELKNWNIVKNKYIEKEFKFKDFKEALNFVNNVGKIAESEGYHPDIFIHGWNKVKIILNTHAINGLSKNDFIVAAKIDKL